MAGLIDIYMKMPHSLKDILKRCYSFVPLELRLGRKFFNKLNFIEKCQWWSRQELENYQDEQLRMLVEYAYHNVPYYYNLFKALKLTVSDIKKQKDLQKLPILTKEIVRSNFQSLCSVNFKHKDVIRLSTSGSTGKPLTVLYEKNKEYLNYDPYVWRFFRWAGLNVGEIYAKISNWILPKDVIYSYNPVRNLLILNSFALNDTNIEKYCEGLEKYKVHHIAGYPNSIAYMTKLFKLHNISKPNILKGVFCHSEYLYDWQRELIEEFWGCKCFNWYGLDERVILGVECEYHENLHLCLDYGITEFIKNPENYITQIVSTSLTNYAMPLLRYNTEDEGYLIDHECVCRRGFPLFHLQGGKGRSFAIGKDGSRIPVLHFGIPKVTKNVLQFQFIQKEQGILDLNIVKGPKFQDEDLKMIIMSIKKNIGENLTIKSSFVSEVEKTKNGKAEIFKQKLSVL